MTILKNQGICFIMIPTYDCNLSCDYCFSKKRNNYLQIDKFEILFVKIKEICEKISTTYVSFYWIGGEVLLLGTDWFEKMYEVSNKILYEQSNFKYKITHHIQTNITLYTTKWKGIFTNIFKGEISSSLDYPNIFRKFHNNTPEKFNDFWLKKREKMLDDGLKVGIISLPNNKSLEMGAQDYYDYYFNKNSFNGLQINNPYTVDFHEKNYNLDMKKYTEFMIDLFKIWWENGYKNGLELRPFTFFLDMMIKPDKSLPCLWSPECGNSFFSIGPNGEIGLCDSIVSNCPELHYGNIFIDDIKNILNNKNRIDFIRRSEKILNSECNDCPYCTICFGGCVTKAYIANHNIFSKDIFCELYKELFKTIEDYSRPLRSSNKNNVSKLIQEKNIK